MAIDIRRCSKEDLDRLNAEARAWRDQKEPSQNQDPLAVETETHKIPTGQLDLEL